MKRFKVFLLNSLLMVGSSFALQIINMIFNIYVSNKINREALGVFQLIMTTYLFAITLAASRNKHYLYTYCFRRNGFSK